MSSNPKTSTTHRVLRITIIDHLGEHDAGTVFLHKSRNCNNCCHDGAKNVEWSADGGVAEFGRCMNLCGAADDEDVENQYCDSHQTLHEFDAYVHRPHTPVFVVIEGGAA